MRPNVKAVVLIALMLISCSKISTPSRPTESPNPPSQSAPKLDESRRDSDPFAPDGVTVAEVVAMIETSTHVQLSAPEVSKDIRDLTTDERKHISALLSSGATFQPPPCYPAEPLDRVPLFPPKYHLRVQTETRTIWFLWAGGPCLSLIWNDQAYYVQVDEPTIGRYLQEMFPVPIPHPDEVSYLFLASFMGDQTMPGIDLTRRKEAVVSSLLCSQGPASSPEDSTALMADLVFRFSDSEELVKVYRDYFVYRGHVYRCEGVGRGVATNLNAG